MADAKPEADPGGWLTVACLRAATTVPPAFARVRVVRLVDGGGEEPVELAGVRATGGPGGEIVIEVRC